MKFDVERPLPMLVRELSRKAADRTLTKRFKPDLGVGRILAPGGRGLASFYLNGAPTDRLPGERAELIGPLEPKS